MKWKHSPSCLLVARSGWVHQPNVCRACNLMEAVFSNLPMPRSKIKTALVCQWRSGIRCGDIIHVSKFAHMLHLGGSVWMLHVFIDWMHVRMMIRKSIKSNFHSPVINFRWFNSYCLSCSTEFDLFFISFIFFVCARHSMAPQLQLIANKWGPFQMLFLFNTNT